MVNDMVTKTDMVREIRRGKIQSMHTDGDYQGKLFNLMVNDPW